jgi:uncharacterized protein YbjT (DUF2867 family)
MEEGRTVAKIFVTGGTGDLGREVLSHLLARQHAIRVLSRQSHPNLPQGIEVVTGDLMGGAGVREAAAGVDTVIHCASDPSAAQATDVGGTRLPAQALQDVEPPPHLIYVSIVGVDQAATDYHRAKYEAESVVAQSQLPWTVLRATHFHSFALSE